MLLFLVELRREKLQEQMEGRAYIEGGREQEADVMDF